MNPQPPHSTPPPRNQSDHAAQIHYEQIKIIYRHLPALIIINAIVSSAMVFGLWNVVTTNALLAWGTAMLLVLVARGILFWCYCARSSKFSGKFWASSFTLGAGLSGLLWGAAGIFLYPSGTLEYQLFILFVLMGMGAGAMTSLIAYMPAFYAFLPVSLLPMGARLVHANDNIYLMLGFMTFTYVAALSFFARPINKAFVESLKLRFENIDLVRDLSLQRDEAERANLSKSKFLAAASHDLRQPLHALQLFTTALDERVQYPEARLIVDNIKNSTHALENLFNALLDVSRLDAGVLEPKLKHFPLQTLYHHLAEDYGPTAESKGLTLKYSPCDTVVCSDPTLLGRILRNFVSNAIRYTKEGRVLIESVEIQQRVRIDVVDTGIGIPREQQKEIFTEFYQLHNPERDRNKGLGLGLAIVDRVARLLQHRIDVQSTSDQGSRFSVTVPLGDSGLVVVETTSTTDFPSGDLNGVQVLVVDDEIGVRDGMFTLLSSWGCELTLAGSENEAIAALAESGVIPDAIIMDYRLRAGCIGTQVLERLQHTLRHRVPALIVTGDTAPERLREAKASGYQLVHKPVQPAKLRAFLHNLRIRTCAS